MLIILEIVVSIFLIGLILLQAKGTGLGGNSGENYSSRRGVEKFVFIGTIVLAALFALLSVGLLILP